MVSDFAASEVASAISRLVKTELVTAPAAELLLARFDRWTVTNATAVTTTSTDIGEAAKLVRRFELKLRTPDALHLVLARRNGAGLVTRDRQMARAAEMLGLSVAPLPA